MPCNKPLSAVRMDDGAIKFNYRSGEGDPINLPCGQCYGCRMDRAKSWMIRILHEQQLHAANCFVTLTYAPEHLPEGGSLDYIHFQKFMKRLRKETGPIRFYMCGEYGEQLHRPHYHAIIFGHDFPDKKLWRNVEKNKLYRSKQLERLWPYGHSSIGEVTRQSAGYVARYIHKKVTGKLADDHYSVTDPETGEIRKLKPEFTVMSRKPGIGSGWFAKFADDVYPKDFVTINGSKLRPPRYYDKTYADLEPDQFEAVQQARIIRAIERASTEYESPQHREARLNAKEEFFRLRNTNYKRDYQ